MNLGAMVTAAARRIPISLRGTITFRETGGNETSGKAVGVPARGTESDGFTAGTAIRDNHRRLSVFPQGLTFAPKSGMTAVWEGRVWNVLGSCGLNPSGQEVSASAPAATISLYRVTLGKP